eukprot:scaffold4031_cov135-Cylindrotheca_fusiformis.AAC.3
MKVVIHIYYFPFLLLVLYGMTSCCPSLLPFLVHDFSCNAKVNTKLIQYLLSQSSVGIVHFQFKTRDSIVSRVQKT